MLSKKERVLAVLEREAVDRPPISAWRHFTESEHDGVDPFVEAMLNWQEKWDFDYMKLQPRASYYEEAFGAEFDYTKYAGVLPTCIKAPIEKESDFDVLTEVSGSHNIFQEQAEVIRKIREKVGDEVPIFQTIMCPTSILQKICNINPIGRYREASREDLLVQTMKNHPEKVHHALKVITKTLQNYAEELKKAGTFGVFYGATGLSRDSYLHYSEWEEFVKPYDFEVFEAMRPMKLMVHACGIYVHPEYFAHYPIDILHWPESAIGNPSLDSSKEWLDPKITPMGGCDERLFGQHKEIEINLRTRDAVKRMKDIPFFLAPDCSLALNTYDEELKAFIEAGKETV